jgi:hypothetical protein
MIPSSGVKESVHLHRTIKSDERTAELSIDIYEMEDDNGANDYPLADEKNRGKQCDALLPKRHLTEIQNRLRVAGECGIYCASGSDPGQAPKKLGGNLIRRGSSPFGFQAPRTSATAHLHPISPTDLQSYRLRFTRVSSGLSPALGHRTLHQRRYTKTRRLLLLD